MIKFISLEINEKFGGHHNGPTPDYRAFLYYDEDGIQEEIRGYGPDPAKAAGHAWSRYLELFQE